MISDIRDREAPALVSADVCVVGAGPAGILIALALSRKGIRTVLLESGGPSFEKNIHDLNRVTQTAKPNDGVSEMRFRALGGATTRWGGQVLPFFQIDMAARPWLGLKAWPVQHADLEPHYEAALTFLGIDDAVRKAPDVWKHWRQDEPEYGEALRPFLSWWCRNPDIGSVYRKEITENAALDCILHASVTALRYEEGRITGLTARDLGGSEIRVTARHVVFCVGAVETPRLLLQPLENGSEGPWARGDALGRYFQDHPGLLAAEVRPIAQHSFHRQVQTFWLRGIKYQPRIQLSERAQIENETLNAGGVIIPETSDPELLAMLRAAAGSLLRGRLNGEAMKLVAAKPFRAASLATQQSWDLLVRKRGFASADLGYKLGVQLEQLPSRDNRITLTKARDALGQRRAALSWNINAAEMRTARVYAEAVKASFESRGIAKVEISPDLQHENAIVADSISDQGHHIGTARMAHNIDEGVVDSTLKIFGTENAYIASSAVFPTGSFSNPTHTILAFAHRLAGHLCQEYGR